MDGRSSGHRVAADEREPESEEETDGGGVAGGGPRGPSRKAEHVAGVREGCLGGFAGVAAPSVGRGEGEAEVRSAAGHAPDEAADANGHPGGDIGRVSTRASPAPCCATVATIATAPVQM